LQLPNPANSGAIKPSGQQGAGSQAVLPSSDAFSAGPSASSIFAAPQASSIFGGVPPAGFDAASSVFGGGMAIGGLAAGSGRRYCARWSHRNPGMVATCSFDRKIIVHAATALGPTLAATTAAQVVGQGSAVDATMRRAPRWLRRPVGAAFGFGGRLVSFACPVAVAKGDLRAGNAEYAKILQVSVINSDYELVSKAAAFESALANIESTAMDAQTLCDIKASELRSQGENSAANEWSYIRALFSDNCRAELFSLLGCETTSIQSELAKYLGAATEEADQQGLSENHVLPPSSDSQQHAGAAERHSGQWTTAEDLFGAPANGFGDAGFAGHAESAQVSPGQAHVQMLQSHSAPAGASQISTSPSSQMDAQYKPTYASCRVPNAADDAVLKKAVLIGDFAAAVAICFKQDRLDDALILASAGGADLWQSTRTQFFQRKNGGLIGSIGGVVRSDLASLVASYPLDNWHEALAMLCTYATNENFNELCEVLGDRLALERADGISAAVAYISAQAVDKVVALWAQTATARSSAVGRSAALQEFVEKVLLFKRAVWVRSGNPPLASAAESHTLASHSAMIASEVRDAGVEYAPTTNVRTLACLQGYLACAAFYAARIQDAPLEPLNPAAGHVLRDRLLRCFLYNDYAAPGKLAVPVLRESPSSIQSCCAAAQALFQAPFPYAVRNIGMAPMQHETNLYDGYAAPAPQADSGRNPYTQTPAARPFSSAPIPTPTSAPAATSHAGVTAGAAPFGQQPLHAYPNTAVTAAVPHATGISSRPAGSYGQPAEGGAWTTHQPISGHAPAVSAPSVPAPAPITSAPPEFEGALAALANVNAWLQSLLPTGKLRPEDKKIIDDAAKALEILKVCRM
jgi:hypothetical protein